MAELYDQSRNDALRRLNQTLLQIDPYDLPPYPNLSIVTGPLDPPLVQLTLSQLLQQQASCYSTEEAVVIPWTNARWTYQKLWEESSLLARALLKEGVRPRDRIGIMSGNCEKYIALFFACARVGAICVTLNNTYTATEMEYALKHTSRPSHQESISLGYWKTNKNRVQNIVYNPGYCSIRQHAVAGKTVSKGHSVSTSRSQKRISDTRPVWLFCHLLFFHR